MASDKDEVNDHRGDSSAWQQQSRAAAIICFLFLSHMSLFQCLEDRRISRCSIQSKHGVRGVTTMNAVRMAAVGLPGGARVHDDRDLLSSTLQ